jgi:Zn-dependent protease
MAPSHKGSIHLFRFAGINVYLHWSWFLLAAWGASNRIGDYSSLIWPVLEYLALFVIVLLHELGHSLACKQVGGQANQIVLWPLGGVAYVAPPQRPGATLWSIAAGPLVNVGLFPILSALWFLASVLGWSGAMPNAYEFIRAVWIINLGLLIFNLLPIYPLDGGQILRSLLWFIIGRACSLMVAAGIGFFGVIAIGLAALLERIWWLGVIAAFILLHCWGGLRQARHLARTAAAPPRTGFACPSCASVPPTGPFWICGRCRKSFDTFATGGVCPHCGAQYTLTRCLECGGLYAPYAFEANARV